MAWARCVVAALQAQVPARSGSPRIETPECGWSGVSPLPASSSRGGGWYPPPSELSTPCWWPCAEHPASRGIRETEGGVDYSCSSSVRGPVERNQVRSPPSRPQKASYRGWGLGPPRVPPQASRLGSLSPPCGSMAHGCGMGFPSAPSVGPGEWGPLPPWVPGCGVSPQLSGPTHTTYTGQAYARPVVVGGAVSGLARGKSQGSPGDASRWLMARRCDRATRPLPQPPGSTGGGALPGGSRGTRWGE